MRYLLWNSTHCIEYLNILVRQLAAVRSEVRRVLGVRLLREGSVRSSNLGGHKFSGAVFRGQARFLVLAVALHHEVELERNQVDVSFCATFVDRVKQMLLKISQHPPP